MVYQGSKNKLSKHLAPIIQSYLKEGMSYVEPFVGGANMIDKIVWDKKYGYDINPCLINLLKHFQTTDQEFVNIDRHQWSIYKSFFKSGIYNWRVGYAGFIASFCGKFFDGYGERDIAPERSLIRERYNNLYKQSQNEQFKNIIFDNKSFNELYIYNSVIYLDPPYKGTRQYNGIKKFNHDELWLKCEEWSKNGNIILLSENDAPSFFSCIWEQDYKYMLGTGKATNRIEKLFIYVGNNV